MAGSRPSGVERYFAWVPTDDPGGGTGPDAGAVHSAGRSCTPAGVHDAQGNLTLPSFMLSPSRVAHPADRSGCPERPRSRWTAPSNAQMIQEESVPAIITRR